MLNNLYVFVEDESIDYSGESTSHPTEKGLPISDHYKRSPIQLSISGKIVDSGNAKAKDILEKIRNLQNSGSLVKYVGRTSLGNLQIQDLSVTATNANWGGYDVSLTLQEVRIAKSAYDAAKSKALAKKQTSAKQVSQGNNNKVYHTVKSGDCVWNLVTRQYKDLKPTFSTIMGKCDWVRDQNPNAFSRPKDYTTLQIGAKLYVGYR